MVTSVVHILFCVVCICPPPHAALDWTIRESYLYRYRQCIQVGSSRFGDSSLPLCRRSLTPRAGLTRSETLNLVGWTAASESLLSNSTNFDDKRSTTRPVITCLLPISGAQHLTKSSVLDFYSNKTLDKVGFIEHPSIPFESPISCMTEMHESEWGIMSQIWDNCWPCGNEHAFFVQNSPLIFRCMGAHKHTQ